ncbi:MAG TPA: S8 family serine peptidase [Planctomycetota bacterium]|nr:S8 family serine peptidase [Planctomycetota bacterium]
MTRSTSAAPLARLAAPPVGPRVHGDPALAGRGVAMAFVDAGFRAHPDLAAPRGRRLRYVDVTGGPPDLPSTGDAGPDAWHGTQTAVVAAGAGALSGPAYRGLASEANLLLVKVGRDGRVRDDDLVRGVRRVVELREELGIRVLNLSVGGDRDETADRSAVVRAVEDAVAAGITVVAAAGNAGCGPRPRVTPPASAPSAVTVGGVVDAVRPDAPPVAYCSSYGPSLDGLVKPEVVAPAARVAAPILPGTALWRRADVLADLDAAPDYLLAAVVRARGREAGLDVDPDADVDVLRAAVVTAARALKLVGRRHQHVDGTSFAAPIVAAVVAQMLELDPALEPAEIKRVLMATARHVPTVAVRRQGFGAVDARRALERVRRGARTLRPEHFLPPRPVDGRVRFHLHDPGATDVRVAGPFNGWSATATPLRRDAAGVWTATVEIGGAAARLPYKFLVDGAWRGDPSNPRSEDDGLGGENAVAELAP